MEYVFHPIADRQSSQIVETVRTADIVSSWRKDFGIDVARLFDGVEHLHLLEDAATGKLGFHPAIEGDAAFYQALRRYSWYHPATKNEFVTAAQYHRSGERVTDVGAGDGGFAAHIPHGLYKGLETDADAVAAAIARGLNVKPSDMADYIRSPNFQTSGLVTAFQVLEHIADSDAFIQQLVELACIGGRVAIGIPDAESYVSNLPDFMLNAPPHHLTWWTENALRAAMQAAGLNIVGVHRFAVEPWERQLWWMAKLADITRSSRRGRFGARLRTRKVLSFLGSWVLQALPIPSKARGSTLLIIGEKTA